jgi:geranylgeranyl reductase family protein
MTRIDEFPRGGSMTRIEPVDVLVVGLGPAGASAAAAAARAGCSVVAIDRRGEAGVPVQCAEFVPAMIGIDVDDMARTVEQGIETMTTYVEREAPDVQDHFPGHMLDRAAFDAALVATARESGARIVMDLNVRRMTDAGRVECADGTVYAPRAIVGADGPRSITGRAIGQVNRALVETRQITVPLTQPQTSTDIFLSAEIRGGYGWLFPKRSVANLGAGVDPAHKTALKAIVGELHRELAQAGRVGPEVLGMTGGAIPVGGMLKPWGRLAQTLVLLAGDAAGLAHPVTGAGIAAAVHSGRLAGEAAAASVGGDAHAHEVYEDELESVFRVALDRAVERRQELASHYDRSTPSASALRRGWIAYPEYWAA